jgi:opacity protein-like surface antigen
MKHGVTAIALIVGFLAASTVSAEDMTGNVQFLIGQRYLQDDFWKPLDSPSDFGLEIDFAPSSSPVHVALGVLVAGESGTATLATPYFGKTTGSIDSRFFEFSAGFLWHPVKRAIVRPYLGAGALTLTAANDSDWGVFSSNSHSDQSFGFYGNAGVFFKVGDSFNIGLDGRIVRGTKVTLGGIEGDADYEQVSMLLGFSWGK